MSTPDPDCVPFEQLFGRGFEAAADAPGRVNLIGEHTDYHHGFVLPTVTPQFTRAEIRRRTDDRVRAWSARISQDVEEYRLGFETRGRGWLDYVQGVSTVLARNNLAFGGFDLRLVSSVPVGAGVSSSAALEVSVLRALRRLFALPIDDVTLARLAQAAETDFVGAAVGIMDQIASSVGRPGEALFLDTRSLAMEHIPLPNTIDLVVIDSGVVHRHAGGEYGTRRRESFEAANALGVDHLRDLGLDALERINALPPVLARRARHVVTENQRVIDAVQALRSGDAPALGALFNASHASMRDDYETSTIDVDALVAIGQQDPAIYGARLTGGGFGGCVVMVARATMGRMAATRVLQAYRARTARHGAVLMVASGGMRSPVT
jgi:galactokinase